jgi:4-amino-4-deoxychorismate lyase
LSTVTREQPSKTWSDNMEIFTTMRFDPLLKHNDANAAANEGHESAIYVVAYHYERLCEAAAAVMHDEPEAEHDWLSSVRSPRDIERAVAHHLELQAPGGPSQLQTLSPNAWRLNLTVSRNGNVLVKSAPVQQAVTPLLFPASFSDYGNIQWTVVLDSQNTEASLVSSFKTSKRMLYDRARTEAKITSPAMTKEVLLYNCSGMIMDGSITTPYLFRANRWVTPSAMSGGQQGVTRRWALRQRLCCEDDVSRASVKPGDVLWLSNALRGFFPAVIVDRDAGPEKGVSTWS